MFYESDILGLSRTISRTAPFGGQGAVPPPTFLEGAEYPLTLPTTFEAKDKDLRAKRAKREGKGGENVHARFRK